MERLKNEGDIADIDGGVLDVYENSFFEINVRYEKKQFQQI